MSAQPNLNPMPESQAASARRRQARSEQENQRQPAADVLAKAGKALTDASMEADAVQCDLLRSRVLPLLALCEFASRAHHSLTNFKHLADHDPATAKRLDDYDEEWVVNLHDEPTLHIGQVLGLARAACMEAATRLQALTEKAGDVRSELRAAQKESGHG